MGMGGGGGRGAGKWEGGQATFTPLFRGGEVRKVYSKSGEERGGQKILKVDIISLGFFKFFQNRMTFNVLVPQYIKP